MKFDKIETKNGAIYTYDIEEFYGKLIFKQKLDGYEFDGTGIFKFKLPPKYTQFIRGSPFLEIRVYHNATVDLGSVGLTNYYFKSVHSELTKLRDNVRSEKSVIEDVITYAGKIAWKETRYNGNHVINSINMNGVKMFIESSDDDVYYYDYAFFGYGDRPIVDFIYRSFEIDEDDGGEMITPSEAIGEAMILTSDIVLGIYDEMGDQIDDLTRIIKGQF